jgi:AraC family transcriptional regulator, melibiose operon regulatory protein
MKPPAHNVISSPLYVNADFALFFTDFQDCEKWKGTVMTRMQTPAALTSFAHSDRHFYSDKKAFGRFGMRIFTPQIMERSHWHGHVEANWLTSGQMHYLVDGAKCLIPSGRLVIFWAGVPHQLTRIDGANDPSQKLCNIYLPLDAFLFMPHLAKLQVALLSGAIIVLTPEVCGYETVQRWYGDYRSGSVERAEIVKMEINTLLRRASLQDFDYILKPWGSDPEKAGMTSAQVRHVVAMVQHVLENLEKPLTSESVAKVTGMHPNYALGLFSKTLNLSLKKFIIRMRLLRARALLMESNLPITTIALESGFSSMTQFYLHFSKAYGTTPYQIRQSYIATTAA